MKAAGISLALVAAALTGCSGASSLPSLPSLTTGSILGGPAKPTAADPGSINDPTNRAFQVGTVSAKAIKCGFNFDPAKLKNNYLTYERTLTPGADLSKVERIYDVSFNGVTKAVAGEADYCSDEKTKAIKADLTRHLAGDYTPAMQAEGSGRARWRVRQHLCRRHQRPGIRLEKNGRRCNSPLLARSPGQPRDESAEIPLRSARSNPCDW